MSFKSLIVFVSISFLIFSCQTNKGKGVASSFETHPLSIIQGATDSDETYISVVSTQALHPLVYEVSEVVDPDEKSKNFKKVEIVKSFWSPKKTHLVEHLHVKNLKAGMSYKIKVKKDGVVVDERSFQPFNSKKSRPRIGVVSCMDDRFDEEATRMWTSYLNKFVDVNFFIGDNVYADFNGLIFKTASVDQLWQRYLETFSKLYIYHTSNLKPTFSMWDDHDYGINDGGADYSIKDESLKLFNIFYPRYKVDGYNLTDFGAGSHLEAYGQSFIFLDSRYYRSVGDKEGSHLGAEQLKFLTKVIKGSNKPVWLIKGDQFFGSYHPFESYERLHPKEFAELIGLLNTVKKPVLFVSGDRHMTEIMKIKKPEFEFESYEITSSGIHAKVFKDAIKNHPNPRQLVGKSGVYNYTVIEVTGEKTYNVSSFGEKNWSHYTRELSL